MKSLKIIWTIGLIAFWAIKTFATTWTPAYPYIQKIDGQNVVVSAIPYDPYSGSPMIGITRVYLNNKLLYSIDKYYRDKIFTSNDGQYLVVVHTTNYIGVSSYSSFGVEKLNFNQPAIEVFKNGLPFKTFTLKDVIDTTTIVNNGRFFYWGYNVDFKAFDEAIWNCNYWRKDLTRSEKKECLDGDTAFYCKEWIRGCDSMKIYEQEKFIYNNSIYVQDNSLFVLTNQNLIVKLDFVSMTIQQIAFDKIVSNKETFNPPKHSRIYKYVKLPDKFDEPRMKDGRSFEKAVADLFSLTVRKNQEKEIFCVFINHLVLDRNGKCVDFFGKVHDERISEFFSPESINDEMTEKLTKWAKEQTFNTKLIPKGFDRYSFLCIIHLN